MYAQRHGDVGRFLLTRGLWLILLELTVLRVAWTFNLEFMRYNLAGVIWVIGWCMVLLALLVGCRSTSSPPSGSSSSPGTTCSIRFSRRSRRGSRTAGCPGCGRFCISDSRPDRSRSATEVLRSGCCIRSCRGSASLPPATRSAPCSCSSRDGAGARAWPSDSAAIALFLVLRGLNLYGDPRPWQIGPRVPQRHEVSGVAVVPADDARADDRADAARSTARAARSRDGSRSSAACRSSTTCCTSR